MDWLFENLGKLAPLVIFLIYMISSLKGRGREEEEPDPEAAERARKIQEEIRRKILERQRGAAPASQGKTASTEARREESFREKKEESFREKREESFHPRAEKKGAFRTKPEVETRVPDGEWEPFRPIPPEPREVVSEAVSLDYEEDPYAAQKRQIAEQLAEAKKLREKALGKRAGAYKWTKPSAHVPTRKLRSEIVAGVRGSHALKKAVVLKEILEKPVSLR